MYGNADDFVEYHEARNRTIPGTWDNDYINAALLVASEWINNIYGSSFIGYKNDFNQVDEWPRISATTQTIPIYTFPEDAIPDRVVYATYEAAFRQATTPGSLQTDYTPGKYKSVTVQGAISVDYAQFSSSAEAQTQIGIVDSLLEPLLDPTSGASISSLSGVSSRV